MRSYPKDDFFQVPAAMFGGPRLLPPETELEAVRDTRTAGGRSAEAVQGMGHDEPDLRGGPGAFRPRAGPQHLRAVQRTRYLGGPKGLAHALQAGRVSPCNFVRLDRSPGSQRRSLIRGGFQDHREKRGQAAADVSPIPKRRR